MTRPRKILTTAGIVGLLMSLSCGLPSDSAMARHFEQHKGAFDELVTMFEQDSSATIIARKPSSVFPDSGPSLPRERYAQYLQLLATTDCDAIVRRAPDVFACNYAVSFWYGCKYFVFSRKPMAPLHDSLDDLGGHDEDLPAYKDLSNGWYIERFR